jgi:hypothetical protein
MTRKPPNPLKDKPSDTEQVNVLFALKEAPDHALAITAAAYVDYSVEMLIRSRMRIDKDEDPRMFGGAGNGILATASSKITIAYAAGLIEKSWRDDLRVINRVRNVFAHSMHKIEFRNSEVAALCRTLSLTERRNDLFPDPATADPRTLYWNTCLDFFMGMVFFRRGIGEDGTIAFVGNLVDENDAARR